MFKNIVVAITANTAGLAKGIGRANTQINSLDAATKRADATGRSLAKTLAKGVAVGAVAVSLALGASVMKAKEFDQSMRNVNTIAKMSEDQFASTSEKVLELSTQLPQSATILADGLYNIASAGFVGADGMQVLEASATAAAAGLTETEVSAKAITGVLNAYGREASDATDVSDTLFKAVEVGVLTFEDLAGNLGSVIGLASAAGVEIDEVSAAMSAITLAGVGPAEASTSLARLIQGIIDPSDELTSKLKNLGYESGQAALDTEGLHGVMATLLETTDGSVESWLALFPEIRAARGAFALAADDGNNYVKTAEAIIDVNNRTGATQDALNEQLESLSLQWDLFTSTVTSHMITFGTRVLPTIIDLLTGVQDLGSTVADTARPFIERLYPAFKSVRRIAEDLWSVVVRVATAFGPLAGAVVGFVAALAIDAVVTFAQGLADIVEWVAESNAVVPVLATVLGILLAPALAGVITKMQVLAVLGLADMIQGMAGAASRLAASLRGVNAAAGALGIVSLALASVVMRNKDLKDSAEEAAGGMKDLFGTRYDPTTAEGAILRLRAQAEGLRDEVEGLQPDLSTGFWDRLGAGFYDIVPGLQSATLEADALNNALVGDVQALEDLALHAEGIVDAVRGELYTALGDVDPSVIYELADALGIDLTTAARDEAIPALRDAAIEAAEGEGDFASLAAEFDTVAGASARMAQGLQEYIDVLLGMTDPLFAAQTAVLDLDEAQAENDRALQTMIEANEAADEALREYGKGSDEAKEALEEADQATKDFESSSRDLAGEVINTEAKLNGLYQSILEGGGSVEEARGAVTEMVESWIEAGTVSPEAAAVMMESFGMVFDRVDGWVEETATKELGIDTTGADVATARLQGQADAWADRKMESQALVATGEADASVDHLEMRADDWDDLETTATASLDTWSALSEFTTLATRSSAYSVSNPTTSIHATATGAFTTLDAVLARIRSIPRDVTTTVTVRGGMGQPGRIRPQADGGIVSYYADGGTFEDHVAQIAPAGAMRVWAEPETGGEAYIPMSQSKRSRSQAILGDVAKEFGYGLMPMARGGILKPEAQGASSGARLQQVFNEGSVVVQARDEKRVARDLMHELRWRGSGGGGSLR